ncbi:MAG TPA: hypothetical protein VFQ06_02595 [Nitrospira sp.]|nr:hypothetical protein [Nitrospira sp.]
MAHRSLRALARQGRLTDAALEAFIQLAQNVEGEMERRRGAERRRDGRPNPDRRSGRTQHADELAFRSHPA